MSTDKNGSSSASTSSNAYRKQWNEFVASTKRKADAHAKVARFWTVVDTMFGLALISTSALTAVMASWNAIPSGVVVGVGCIGTILASMNSFLKPAKKQNLHHAVSTNLRSLRFQMICCETKEKYKKLWDDFNQQISEEPLIFPKRFAKPLNQDGEQQLKMTCELDKALNMAKSNEKEHGEMLGSCDSINL